LTKGEVKEHLFRIPKTQNQRRTSALKSCQHEEKEQSLTMQLAPRKNIENSTVFKSVKLKL